VDPEDRGGIFLGVAVEVGDEDSLRLLLGHPRLVPGSSGCCFALRLARNKNSPAMMGMLAAASSVNGVSGEGPVAKHVGWLKSAYLMLLRMGRSKEHPVRPLNEALLEVFGRQPAATARALGVDMLALGLADFGRDHPELPEAERERRFALLMASEGEAHDPSGPGNGPRRPMPGGLGGSSAVSATRIGPSRAASQDPDKQMQASPDKPACVAVGRQGRGCRGGGCGPPEPIHARRPTGCGGAGAGAGAAGGCPDIGAPPRL
jgi:hypothetical protein